MLSHSAVPRREGWFSRGGEDYDVVIATCLSLARNVEDLPFPHALTPEDSLTLRKRVEHTFATLPEDYLLLDNDAIRPDLARFYRNRGLLSAAEPGCFSVLAPDDSLTVHLGGDDHLLLAASRGGWDPAGTLVAVQALDRELEEHLSWAVSLRLGYLSPRVETVGTGLIAEAVLFLPALAQGSEDGAAVIAVANTVANTAANAAERVAVVPLRAGTLPESSLYRVRCVAHFPEREEDTIALLEESVRRLVHYEREARSVLAGEHRLAVSDAVHRAWGLLGSALALTRQEAVAQSALVRLGAAAGLIESVDIVTATVMLFAADDDAVAILAPPSQEGESLDERRAALMKSIIRDRA